MEQPFFPVTRREAERSGVQYSSEANKNALFPSQLRELRTEKGVSQEALSKVLGVSKSTIGLWENGDTLPDAKAIYDLAAYFGVSTEYILCKTRTRTADADLKRVCEYTGLSEHAVKNIRSFCCASDREAGQDADMFSAALFVSEILENPDLYHAMMFTFQAIDAAAAKKYNIYDMILEKGAQSQEEKSFLEESEKVVSDAGEMLGKYGKVIMSAEQAEEYALMKAKGYINDVIAAVFESMESHVRKSLEAKLKEI